MPDRFISLTEGVAMIVTDLHGDRDAFTRYVRRFRELYQLGEVQRLVFLGDLIHGYGSPDSDSSLSMVLEVIALRQEYGPDKVIMLLGNHELPHIYGISLSKGDIEFTPRFEHALGGYRAKVLAFFDSLPFAIRTEAGVLLTHAGPALSIIGQAGILQRYDHQTILQDAENVLAQADDLAPLYQQYSAVYGEPYDEDAAHYLAIQGPGDPRYHHLLRAFLIAQQNKTFEVLWEALITQNEIGVPEFHYVQGCQRFLEAFSVGAPVTQRVIISGHMITPMGGFALVNRYHLRLSSATHARPREAGLYLLLDCARPARSVNDLLGGLGSVFREDEEE
jgi:hypothetical protein